MPVPTHTTPHPTEIDAAPLPLPRVVIAGYGHLHWATLKATLEAHTHKTLVLCGVYQWPRLSKALQREEHAMLRYLLAKFPEVPLLNPHHGSLQTPEETHRLLNLLKPDAILVASWGEILKAQWLQGLGSIHIWNIHPSLLPAHRGSNPYAAAILAGEAQSGVTLHQLTADVDAGDVLAQWPVEVSPSETSVSLRERIAYSTYQLMQQVWKHQASNGGLASLVALANPQPIWGASLHRHHLVGQTLLNWASPLPVLYRQSRACLAWALPRVLLNNRLELSFTKLHVQATEVSKHAIAWGHPASKTQVYVEPEALHWGFIQLPLPRPWLRKLVQGCGWFPLGWITA